MVEGQMSKVKIGLLGISLEACHSELVSESSVQRMSFLEAQLCKLFFVEDAEINSA